MNSDQDVVRFRFAVVFFLNCRVSKLSKLRAKQYQFSDSRFHSGTFKIQLIISKFLPQRPREIKNLKRNRSEVKAH